MEILGEERKQGKCFVGESKNGRHSSSQSVVVQLFSKLARQVPSASSGK